MRNGRLHCARPCASAVSTSRRSGRPPFPPAPRVCASPFPPRMARRRSIDCSTHWRRYCEPARRTIWPRPRSRAAARLGLAQRGLRAVGGRACGTVPLDAHRPAGTRPLVDNKRFDARRHRRTGRRGRAAARRVAGLVAGRDGRHVAMHIALAAPARVKRLILVASSPRFVTDEDWPHAMNPAVLAGFAQALEQDYRATRERFLSLQVTTATAEGRETLRALRAMLLQQSPPSLPALRAGLAILQTADLRTELSALACPLQMILGARDRLVPAAVGVDVQRTAPAAQAHVMTDAAHAPFLSHPREFLALLTEFFDHAHA